MIRRPPRSTRTYTLFPYTTRFRSLFISGLQRPFELAGAVDDGLQRFRRHAHAALDAVGVEVDHPLDRQVAFHHRAADVAFELLAAEQLAAPFEVRPDADQAFLGWLDSQAQPALGRSARGALVYLLHARTLLVHRSEEHSSE